MNWEALGAIGELVGAAGVIATLAYLATQVRQNSRAVRSSTRSEIAKTQMEINFILARDPELAKDQYALWQGEEVEPETRRIAASQYISGCFRTFENQYHAYLDGSFDESVWLGYKRNIEFTTEQQNFPDVWASRRHLFSSEFAAFMDELHRAREGQS